MSSEQRRTVVDLSHPVRAGMTTHPGLPGPEITDHLSRAAAREVYPAGTEFQIGRISMVANTGTYVDVPFHRYADGADLAAVPVAALADLPGLTVSATGDRAVTPAAFAAVEDAIAGRAVLIRTGWDRHWGTDGYGAPDHPYLTAAATAWLVARRPALVGIDSVNIDDLADRTRPAHTVLLGAGIPVVEHLTNLAALPERDFRFTAAPVAVAGMGTFPVRAHAVLP
ncbi:cyclase [Pilimelia anulata]|uniref:Cyclase n=1 Tax=Pilimelia anulata TaxID=53371 RepID=A0A8J3F727_9ACTN|nr:cyclase family protein [Pilimelia anulata]GGJ85173.1 cyclase [Pilimelia anulata]